MIKKNVLLDLRLQQFEAFPVLQRTISVKLSKEEAKRKFILKSNINNLEEIVTFNINFCEDVLNHKGLIFSYDLHT